ncbi:MAG: LppX_LprAFG lipoprotein [Acidimicrobiia bacterium]|nr:LppX_LprAFG lipoprotein [Acidimicrobiia bacterium]NNJ46933.1 LppX_LprAFG lipoprotein [Acidimicrobiia bacterium]
MARLGILAIVIVLAATACKDDTGATSSLVSTTAPLTVEEILTDAAATMQAVETLRYEISLSGAPITLLGVELRSAAGQYAAPESSQALLEAAIGGLTIELATIAIGETSWLTNPLTGAWDEYTGSRAFNPAIIFDPELGWKPLLTTDLTDASYTVEGDSYIVTGTAAGARVEVLTAGLVESQPVDIRFEINRDSFHVTRMDFATSGDAGVTDWLLELSEFDEPVSINPPEVDGG